MTRRCCLLALALLACTTTAGPAKPAITTPSAPSAARTDSSWAATASGCGDFQVYVAHASKRRILHIRGSRAALGLDTAGAIANVSLATAGPLQLTVDVYPAPGGEEHYCNDVVSTAPVRSAELPAAAGTVTVRLARFVDAHDFDLEISLRDVLVRAESGKLEPIADATFPAVRVGWLPG